MSHQEQYRAVQDALQYMIEEGMVKKIGNKYRLKTEVELEQEMLDLLED